MTISKDEILQKFAQAESIGIFCDCLNYTKDTILYFHGEKTCNAEVRAIDLFEALGKTGDGLNRIFSKDYKIRHKAVGYMNFYPYFYLELAKELNKKVRVSYNSGQGPYDLFCVYPELESDGSRRIEYYHFSSTC